MDCLPVELVLIVLTWGGPLYIKINRLVCHAWRELLLRPKSSRPPLEEAAREGWWEVFGYITHSISSLLVTKRTLKYCARNGWPIDTTEWRSLLPYSGKTLLLKLARRRKLAVSPLQPYISYDEIYNAIASGDFDYISIWSEVIIAQFEGHEEFCSHAVKYGHLNIVKLFHARGYEPRHGCFTKATVTEKFINWWIANMGSFCEYDCSEVLVHGTPKMYQLVIQYGGKCGDTKTLGKYAEQGRWEVIDKAYATGMVPDYYTTRSIAKSGNIERLRQALERCNLWDGELIRIAAKTTNPEIVKVIISRCNIGNKVHSRYFVGRLLQHGNISILELYKEIIDPTQLSPYYWGISSPKSVQFLLSLSITPPLITFCTVLDNPKWSTRDLLWLLGLFPQNDLPKILTPEILTRILHTGRIKLFRKILRLTDTICPGSIPFSQLNLDVLYWALKREKFNYIPWIVTMIDEGKLCCMRSNPKTVELAIDHNHKRLFHWLVSKKYSITSGVYLVAAKQHNIPFMEYLYSLGLKIPSAIYYVAYLNANLSIIDWALARGCQWNYFRFTIDEDKYIGFLDPYGIVICDIDTGRHGETLEVLIRMLGDNIIKPATLEPNKLWPVPELQDDKYNRLDTKVDYVYLQVSRRPEQR
jgi:hypothetical protein